MSVNSKLNDSHFFDSASDQDFNKRLQLAKDGDEEHRAELLNGFRDYLRSVAKHQVSKELKAKLSISDFAQDALIAAQDAFDDCRAGTREEVKAWLRQVLMDHVQQEEKQRLLAAMDLLSSKDRQLIDMRHRDGETFAEIGKKLNQTSDQTRMAWNRAIEKLAKILKRE